MAYKLSDRHNQDELSAENNSGGGDSYDADADKVDLGKIATVFIIFGLLGLLTAWIYSMNTERIGNISFRPTGASSSSAEIGPLTVRKHNETYSVSVNANLASQSWASIEGQVLNSSKEYLYSFGKELSYYSGRDYEGGWAELENTYSINITFPKPGIYYLKFNTQSNRLPRSVSVKISKKRGSSIPHMWFGIISLIIGIALNEAKNRTFRNALNRFEQ